MEEFDYIIIGSGFGGSVSAMRLAQKGYKVAVLEAGKRFRSEDFPETNFNFRKFFWFPKFFCYGIQRIHLLDDVLVLSGAGVGGGSLVYANTLYVPSKKFFETKIIQKMGGEDELLPFYHVAQKMLGVVENPRLNEVDDLMRKTAAYFGVEKTFRPTPVGVNFHEQNGNDPYFEGEGPLRNACNFCGGCMVGCRFNAKNTLDKNYLFFAEELGAQVFPETTVLEVHPLGERGENGYEIFTKSSTNFLGYPHKKFRAKGVVFSAGVLGTLDLLIRMKEKNILPNLSKMLGKVVRTNSESIVGVTSLNKNVDYSKGIAISSSVYPDEDTHIEPVRYPEGSDAMGFLAAPTLIDGGGSIPRQLRFLLSFIRHPLRTIRFFFPFGFAKRSIILLVMQTVDNSIEILRKRKWFFPFVKTLGSIQESGKKIPTYLPIANQFARKLAQNINGIARSSINEVALNIPMTAHILGGSIIGENPEEGVIDLQNRVFGYDNMFVCDGSMIPVNLGVNPSLTIVALTERAMSYIPEKDNPKFFEFEKKWNVLSILTRKKEFISQINHSQTKEKLSTVQNSSILKQEKMRISKKKKVTKKTVSKKKR